MPSARGDRTVSTGPLIDNTRWSLLSVVLLVGVARSGTPAETGAAAAALTVYTVVVLAVPVPVGDVLLLRRLVGDRGEVARAAGAVAFASLFVATAVAAVGWWIEGPSGRALVVLALALPVLTLHEVARAVAYGRQRVAIAVWSDGLWLLLAVCSGVLVDEFDADTAVALWSASGAVAFVVAARALRLSVSRPAGWIRDNRARVAAYSTGASLQAAATQSGFLVSLWFLDLAEFAAIRLTFMLFGPLTVIHNAIGRPLLTTAGVEGLQIASLRRARVALVGSSIAVGVVILLMPDPVGVELLGESWDEIRRLTAWLVAATVARGLAAVWIWQLMICGENRRLVWARAGGAVASATGIVVGAALGGAVAAAIGLAVGNWLGAGLAGASCRGTVRSDASGQR
jgi:O-antigen/teichoic acid export membrane protein